MNIRISRPHEPVKRKWLIALAPFAKTYFGIMCLILFFILVAAESYYRTVLHWSKESIVIHIGGFASLIGLILLIPLFVNHHRKGKWLAYIYERYRSSVYMVLTDEYFEKGLTDIWSVRYNWCLLRGVTETGKSFVLEISNEIVCIEKSDLKAHITEEDFRSHLSRKMLANKGNKILRNGSPPQIPSNP